MQTEKQTTTACLLLYLKSWKLSFVEVNKMAKLIKHRSIGKIRMELADYVLNCTDDELYELCGAVSELKGVTSWSCDEYQKG